MTATNAAQSPVAPLDGRLAHLSKDFEHTPWPLCCRVDPTGRYVFVGGTDHTIQRWEIATGVKTLFSGHTNWVPTLGFSPDGATLYSGSYDGSVMFWDVAAAEPKPVRIIEGTHKGGQPHLGWVRSLAVSPDGKSIATGGNDGMVRLWSTEDGSLIREFPGHSLFVLSVLFHPGTHDLISGDLKSNIHQWDVKTGALARKFELAAYDMYFDIGDWSHYGGILGLAVSPDHKHLVASGLHKPTNALTGNQQGVAHWFDWESGAKVLKQESIKDARDMATMWRSVFHASGQLIGPLDKFVGFWKAGEEDLYHAFETPSPIHDIDLHPNQVDLFTAHFDGHIRQVRVAAATT
ncbi:MAG: WD40 repeat domain-containing protein [Planctomycetota bacterium]|nr:WD40 repeat domain-containing protein [Planctomycetota bacterium]